VTTVSGPQLTPGRYRRVAVERASSPQLRENDGSGYVGPPVPACAVVDEVRSFETTLPTHGEAGSNASVSGFPGGSPHRCYGPVSPRRSHQRADQAGGSRCNWE